MLFKKLLVSAAALFAVPAIAHPISGTWQGPCETRGNLSVKFTYVISDVAADGTGIIDKTKIYYNDAACAVYARTGRQAVSFVLSEPDADGIYNLDVNHRGTVLYDIVFASEDGQQLIFGDEYSRNADGRPTTLSTTDRVFDLVVE